jgi:uncharacterized membrane-anchored protein YhcB (DUF1043 family)
MFSIHHLVIFVIGGIVGALIVLNNYRRAKAIQAELQAKIDELKAKVK